MKLINILHQEDIKKNEHFLITLLEPGACLGTTKYLKIEINVSSVVSQPSKGQNH